jgi:tRNA (uracil-5-)-methyltransferase TRM9
VKPQVSGRLVELNRQFYHDFGEPFAATRGRLQPGVLRVLDSLKGDESILDLGCGNGELARALARRAHRGAYLGLDFSVPLLGEAKSMPEGFSATFLQADLTSGWMEVIPMSREVATVQTPDNREIAAPPMAARNDSYEVVFSFAAIHHIPSHKIRLEILKAVNTLLAPGGRFVHSNWQFLNSPRLRGRIQPWSAIGLQESDVDPGDYLLDWRAGGTGLRYVHHFNEEELAELAASSGFTVVDTFTSDGRQGNLAVYQEWAAR